MLEKVIQKHLPLPLKYTFQRFFLQLKRERTESISTNGIINDTKCKIDPSSSVKTRNYIEVPASDNVNFKRPVFKNGAKLRISYTAGNVDSGKIMNTIDSSTFDKKVSTV